MANAEHHRHMFWDKLHGTCSFLGYVLIICYTTIADLWQKIGQEFYVMIIHCTAFQILKQKKFELKQSHQKTSYVKDQKQECTWIYPGSFPYTLRPLAESCMEYNPGLMPMYPWSDLDKKKISYDIQILKFVCSTKALRI